MSQEILEKFKTVLAYCEESGDFRWLVNRGGASIGKIAGCFDGELYIQLRLFGKSYKAHRVAWLYVYGEWPKNMIDHINGIKHDNRIANLRDVTAAENSQNRSKPQSNNKTGLLGVSRRLISEVWYVARIGVGKKAKDIGVFRTKEEAYAAYLEAKSEIHPMAPRRTSTFNNHGSLQHKASICKNEGFVK